MAKGEGGGDDDHDRRRALHPVGDDGESLVPVEAAIEEQADDEGSDGGERRRLGHRDDAAIDATATMIGTARAGSAPAVTRAISSQDFGASRGKLCLRA